mgnify:FL=1
MNFSRFLTSRFNRQGRSALPELGPLEREVMQLIWAHRQEVSVRDVHQALAERLAYTTLMTTLDRLHKKGLLDRRKEGRAFFYSACISAEDFERNLTRNVIDRLLGHDEQAAEPVLACIVDAVSANDHQLLDELERLIQEKRRASLSGSEPKE